MSLTQILNKNIIGKVADSISEAGKLQDERGTSFMQKSYRDNMRRKKYGNGL